MNIRNLKKTRWLWIIALVLLIIVELLARNSSRIEIFYTSRFYYFFSLILRVLLGWIPFSVGDVFYFAAGCWLLWKLVKYIRLLLKKRLSKPVFFRKVGQLLLVCVFIYVVFNIFWGLNYNRKGITWQLQLQRVVYDTANLILMQELLLQKVNETKRALVSQKAAYPDNHTLFIRAKECYDVTQKRYPFIQYRDISIKSSLYGWLGNYLGFTGYYNPFTGEAQVNTSVPRFLIPYIALHEIGHQLGYAKEDEANFSGYLAAANSTDTLFQYSTYLDLFTYANREVFYFDSTASRNAAKQLTPAVRSDLLEWRRFNRSHRSIFEPAISWMYGKYLEVNQQPGGLRSYSEVIAMLMAYYKKFGRI
jgi:hypothetical protein